MRAAVSVRALVALVVSLLAAPAALAADGGGSGGSIPDGQSVELRLVADGLTVPVFLTEPDDGTGRRFVVDQVGRVRILEGEQGLLAEPFLDLSDRLVELDPGYDERGLLGLAFHPGYRENGRFFVYYSAPLREEAPDGWDHTSRLAEFRVSADDPNRADPSSERIVLEIDQPFANHNAGHIGFGHDGYLYVPLGDGGNGGDRDPEDDDRGRPELGNAQDWTTLLGSILRLDVDADEPYGVPDDNPLVGTEAREEIWAYGFRNPYGLSFDLETGDAYAADAGQALYEEVSRVEPGGNHGWNIKEGTHCFDPGNFLDEPGSCPDEGPRGEPLVDPVVEYERGPDTGSVIVAGVLYRGDRLPELTGRFVFGDYGRIRFTPSGVLYAADPGERRPWPVERLVVANPLDGRADGELGRWVLGVSQDLDGELYVLTTKEGGPTGSTGEVFALHPPPPADEGALGGASPWWWVGIGFGVLLAVAAGVAGALLRRRDRRSPAASGPGVGSSGGVR